MDGTVLMALDIPITAITFWVLFYRLLRRKDLRGRDEAFDAVDPSHGMLAFFLGFVLMFIVVAVANPIRFGHVVLKAVFWPVTAFLAIKKQLDGPTPERVDEQSSEVSDARPAPEARATDASSTPAPEPIGAPGDALRARPAIPAPRRQTAAELPVPTGTPLHAATSFDDPPTEPVTLAPAATGARPRPRPKSMGAMATATPATAVPAPHGGRALVMTPHPARPTVPSGATPGGRHSHPVAEHASARPASVVPTPAPAAETATRRGPVDPVELIASSAEAAAQIVGTKPFAKLTKAALTLTIPGLQGHVTDTDHPGLFAPIDVERGGKERLGGILVLRDRGIIAWDIGSFGTRSDQVVVPLASISTIERGTQDRGARYDARETLRLMTHDGEWVLIFRGVFDGGRSIVPWIEGMLKGAIEPRSEGA